MATLHVQSKSYVGYYGGNATPTLAFTGNVVAGNLICGFVMWPGTTITLNSVTDNLGNTYTRVNNPTRGANYSCAQFYIISGFSGACTITCTLSADPNWGAYTCIIIHEASGVAAASPLYDSKTADQNNPGSGADAITTATVTPLAGGAYMAAFSTGSIAGTWTKGTSWDSLRENNGAGLSCASESLIQAVAAALAGKFTSSTGSTEYMTGVMAFAVAAAGGGGNPWYHNAQQ